MSISGEREVLLALVDALRDPDSLVRSNAAYALANLDFFRDMLVIDPYDGMKASPIIHPESHPLREIGELAAPALVDALQDDYMFLRINALHALEIFSPYAVDAVGVLIEVLSDEIGDVRKHAATVLGMLGPGAGESVPALIGLLNDEIDEVRSTALAALGRIGPAANQSEPLLLQALQDEITDVRKCAAMALAKIDPDRERVVPELIKAMQSDAEPEVRHCAVIAMQRIGIESDPVLQAVVGLLDDDDLWIRSSAMDVLRKQDLDDELRSRIVPALIKELGRPDNRLRHEALMLLAKIGPQAASAVPAIMEFLTGDEREIRFWSVFALGKIGPPASGAIHELVELMNYDEDAEVRKAAQSALHQIFYPPKKPH